MSDQVDVHSISSSRRLGFIDGLRGWAIAGVLLVHCGQNISDLSPLLRFFTNCGGRGVELFFMLSALTLMLVYDKHQILWNNFYVRRFLRLAPMFYVGTMLYMVLGAPMSLRDTLITFGFLQNFDPASLNILMPGGWSISDEAMFYLLFPVFMEMLTTWQRSLVALILAAILSRICFLYIPIWLASTDYPPNLTIAFAGFTLPTQLVSFICGFVIFHVLRLADLPLHPRINTCFFFAIVALMLAISLSGKESLSNYLFADFCLSLFVIASYASQNILIVNRVICYVGRISYSIYIVHFAIIGMIKTILLPNIRFLPPTEQFMLIYILAATLSVCIATLTYFAIEQPAIKFAHRLSPSRIPYRTRELST